MSSKPLFMLFTTSILNWCCELTWSLSLKNSVPTTLRSGNGVSLAVIVVVVVVVLLLSAMMNLKILVEECGNKVARISVPRKEFN